MAIQKLNEKHMAITIGTFAAVMNAIWAIVVMVGSGPTFVNWMKNVHFLTEPTETAVFSLFGAVQMIVVAFIFGAILGWIFAKIWNWTATQTWAK